MSDKEPRRRKKRKDSQSQRKDDIRTEDHIFISTKSESKDSDQEIEEEIVIPSHQPSVFAKFVFVLLFSGLVVSMSFIFISLQGADRGEVEIFGDHHAEEVELLHDDHDVHDDHDDHDDHDVHDDHDDHDDVESPQLSLRENIADFFPGIGSILSFNDELPKESGNGHVTDDLKEKETSDEQISELPESSTVTDEDGTIDASTVNIDDTKDNQEETDPGVEEFISSKIYTETTQEYLEPLSYIEESEHKPVLEEDLEQTSQNVPDDSYFESYTPETESFTESYLNTEEISSSTAAMDDDVLQSLEPDNADSNDFVETTTESTEEHYPYYEKESITNEADYKIRDQLDELDDLLHKEFDDDLYDDGDDNNNEDNDINDDNDTDDEDDDDDDEGEEGAGDEFDFWQF